MDRTTTGNTAPDGKAAPDAKPAARRRAGVPRLLLAGLIVAVPLGLTLLTWALSLMFLLGLFFFMLFGLMIGATMYRFAEPARPIRKTTVITATAIVTVTCWLTAVYKECVDFPADFVDSTMKNEIRFIPPGPNGYAQVRQELSDFIVEHLKEHHPPGGILGYLRLAATASKVTVDLPSQPQTFTVRPRASIWVWWTRVTASLALLFVAIYSITSGLSKPPDRAGDARSAPGRRGTRGRWLSDHRALFTDIFAFLAPPRKFTSCRVPCGQNAVLETGHWRRPDSLLRLLCRRGDLPVRLRSCGRSAAPQLC